MINYVEGVIITSLTLRYLLKVHYNVLLGPLRYREGME